MPNEGAMAQLSRPYQIGLAAVAVLAAAWLLLHPGHTATAAARAPRAPRRSRSPPRTPSPRPPRPAQKCRRDRRQRDRARFRREPRQPRERDRKGPRRRRRLKGPGKAARRTLRPRRPRRPAVSTTRRIDPAQQHDGSPSQPLQGAPAAPPSQDHRRSTRPTKTATRSRTKAPAPDRREPRQRTGPQYLVEAQLAHGKVAVILFWNPKAPRTASCTAPCAHCAATPA